MTPPSILEPLPPLQASPVLTDSVANTGPALTPQQRLSVYSPDQWETFVLEWVRSLSDRYIAVEMFAGANDGGIDIAGLLTELRLEGDWDCYQCKHYRTALQPNHVWGELLKVFLGVEQGRFSLPRNYFFVAPRGIGPTLSRLLNSPEQLRLEFIEQLRSNSSLTSDLERNLLDALVVRVQNADFSLFKSAQLADVLEQHRTTPFYAARFGGSLPQRDPAEPAPAEIQNVEARYLEQLIDLYAEAYEDVESQAAAFAHSKAGPHLRRQREAFFSAESLRRYARDSVPDGTFEALQEEVFESVVETHDREFEGGLGRLTAVLEFSVQAQLTRNALISRTDPVDRRGMCHQLANADRLNWMSGISNANPQ